MSDEADHDSLDDVYRAAPILPESSAGTQLRSRPQAVNIGNHARSAMNNATGFESGEYDRC